MATSIATLVVALFSCSILNNISTQSISSEEQRIIPNEFQFDRTTAQDDITEKITTESQFVDKKLFTPNLFNQPPYAPPPSFVNDPNIETPSTTIVPSPTSSPSMLQQLNERCGQQILVNPLILFGRKISTGELPWLAAMFHILDSNLEFQCGATLISNKHIITAAHCTYRDQKPIRENQLVFLLGKLNLKSWPLTNDEKMVGAETIFRHPNYIDFKVDADLAIILLSEQIRFSFTIRPVCLWTEEDNDLNLVENLNGTVAGWGKTEAGILTSDEPSLVKMPIVGQENCKQSHHLLNLVTSEKTFCAGRRDGTGPCYGDAGSGFVMKRNKRWFLRGITSIELFDYRHVTCDLSNYVVFTDVTKYTDWILSVMQLNY